MIRNKGILLCILLSLSVLTSACRSSNQESVEDAYRKINEAKLSGDIETFENYFAEKHLSFFRERISHPKLKEMVLEMWQTTPSTYEVQEVTVSADGKRATMKVSAGIAMTGGQPEPMLGEVLFIMEDGRWKLEREAWTQKK
jgi:ketosteroid isomerase-like protein